MRDFFFFFCVFFFSFCQVATSALWAASELPSGLLAVQQRRLLPVGANRRLQVAATAEEQGRSRLLVCGSFSSAVLLASSTLQFSARSFGLAVCRSQSLAASSQWWATKWHCRRHCHPVARAAGRAKFISSRLLSGGKHTTARPAMSDERRAASGGRPPAGRHLGRVSLA